MRIQRALLGACSFALLCMLVIPGCKNDEGASDSVEVENAGRKAAERSKERDDQIARLKQLLDDMHGCPGQSKEEQQAQLKAMQEQLEALQKEQEAATSGLKKKKAKKGRVQGP